ncbi:unnamed protein product [Cyclocybe aegerita]|uniref:F-box domain-containing protein n=1 Tax=Cyclocybe aegerita TaxID=1973307 RepID=A0A8S0W1B0_CYCAE|nr:unnamed protein product [Cyclocybe aegerita]
MDKNGAPMADYDKITEAIENVEKLIQVFCKKKYQLKAMLNLNTPIMKRLTREMLARIFILINESVDTMPKMTMPTPFLLAQVCTAWRKLVQSTPRLWSTISISFSTELQEGQRRMLKEWLTRSANYPLDVRIYRPMPKSTTSDPESGEPPQETILLLLASSAQWQSFTVLDGGPFQGLRDELASEFHHFPNLQSVAIHGHANGCLLWNFHSPPRLKTVRFDRLGRASNLCVDWKIVHHLDATVGITDCMFVLPQALSLKTLKFDMRHEEPEDTHLQEHTLLCNPEAQPIDLAFLTDLSVRSECKGQNFDTLFGKVLLPALKNLSVEVSLFSQRVQWWSSFLDSIDRSECTLTHLSITTAGNPSEDEILDFLRFLPSLEHLTLCTTLTGRSRTPLTDATVDFLTVPQQEPYERPISQYLPSLKSFSYNGNVEVDPETILSMIQSRTGSQRPEGEHTTLVQKLESFKLIYHNKSWAQEQNPNRMQHFYFALAKMVFAGIVVDLVWDPEVKS